MYKPWVSIPEQDMNYCYMIPQDSTSNWTKLQEISNDIPKQSFSYKRIRFLKLAVGFGEKEPRDALSKIKSICIDVKRKFLILTDMEPLTLDEWEQRQMQNIADVLKSLLLYYLLND